MVRTSLVLTGLLAVELAQAAPAPRTLLATAGIDLHSTVGGAAFCDTSQRAILALASGELVALDAAGKVTAVASMGRPLGMVQLACDRRDRILVAVGSSITTVDRGVASSLTGPARYVRTARTLDDGTIGMIDADGAVWRWDGSQLAKEWLAPIQSNQPPGRIALRGDGKAVAVSGYDATTIYRSDGSAPLPGPRAYTAVWRGKELVFVHRAGLARWTPGDSLDRVTILDAKLTGFQLAIAGRRVLVSGLTTAELRELDTAGNVIGSTSATRLPGSMKTYALGDSSFGVVASGSFAHVLDLAKPGAVVDDEHPLDTPRALAFSPDGSNLAMLGGDNDLIVVDVRRGLARRQLAPGKRIYSSHLAWATDGSILATGDRGYVRWDRSGAVTSTAASVLGFSRAGELIERTREGGVIVHRRSGEVTLELGPDPIQRAVVDDKHAAIGRNKRIELYSLDPRASHQAALATSHEVRFAMHVALAGTRPRAFYFDDRALYALDAKGDHELGKLSGFATALAVSKNRRLVAVATSEMTGAVISIWDADSGKRLRDLTPSGQVTSLAWSPDGKQLAVATARGVELHPTR